MFDKLIRRLFESTARARVGFLSEPTAIVAGDHRDRKVRVVTAQEWYELDKKNGEDAAAATVDRYADGKDYALVVSAASTGVTVVTFASDHERVEFGARFLAEATVARTLLGGSIREARINPPPPPPPPGHPPWDVVARLDALIRVIRIPIVNATLDANLREGIVDPNFREGLVDPNVRGGGPG